MNCTDCDMPLEKDARFCRNCGRPVPVSIDNSMQTYQSQPVEEDSPTAPIELSPIPLPTAPTPPQPPQQLWLRSASNGASPSPSPYYQPTQPIVPGTMPSNVQSAGPQPLSVTGNTRPRRRGRRFLFGLLVFIIVVVAIWFLGLRPFLHTFAQNQIDPVLSNAVNQLPANAALLPPGVMVVQENEINNLIVLNSAPSDPIQHSQVHITPNGVRMDFQVYGFPCAVTGLPQIINGPLHGQLSITNVKVEGIITLIMSPEEVTSLVNRHLADAQARFKHPILGISLKDHEMDLLVGPAIANVP